MSAVELLQRLKKNGVDLSLNGDKLRYSAPVGTLSESDKAEIVHHKAELLALLYANDAAPTPIPATVEPDADYLAESFEERAGIIEEACHVSRVEAERAAFEVVYCKACQHFQPNKRNPQAGAGGCALGSRGVSAVDAKPIIRWPMAGRYCQQWLATAKVH